MRVRSLSPSELTNRVVSSRMMAMYHFFVVVRGGVSEKGKQRMGWVVDGKRKIREGAGYVKLTSRTSSGMSGFGAKVWA